MRVSEASGMPGLQNKLLLEHTARAQSQRVIRNTILSCSWLHTEVTGHMRIKNLPRIKQRVELDSFPICYKFRCAHMEFRAFNFRCNANFASSCLEPSCTSWKKTQTRVLWLLAPVEASVQAPISQCQNFTYRLSGERYILSRVTH